MMSHEMKAAQSAFKGISPRILPIPERRNDLPLTQIAFVKTQDRAEGVARALEMLGINPVEGKQVLIKPNWNTRDATPGSTHNDALGATVEWVQGAGGDQIEVGDRSYEGARSVMKALGVYDMAEAMGFEALSFNDLATLPENWEWVMPEESHWEHGFTVAKPVMEAESILSLCCLKTHQYGGQITMSLKNSVGVLPKYGPAGEKIVQLMDELHRSPHQRKLIAEINLAYTPDLIVLDGVEAFTEGGPMTGKRANTEVILVGTDRVAIDAVGVAILRKFGTTPAVSEERIFDVEQIAHAATLGIGVGSADLIELVTDDPDSAAYAAEIADVLLEQG